MQTGRRDQIFISGIHSNVAKTLPSPIHEIILGNKSMIYIYVCASLTGKCILRIYEYDIFL